MKNQILLALALVTLLAGPAHAAYNPDDKNLGMSGTSKQIQLPCEQKAGGDINTEAKTQERESNKRTKSAGNAENPKG